ncbi:DoxX family protein [Natronogracilivirga saccharolytica]|uniref:DoxX family protein n=1 Tax=Natronogracilivirga saccharolytica TaxID=2812953 RepID=A0A8J7SCJ7_9BACT|nr:DoxX family protein [Natronogracilivirga saccharolytica]
MVYWFICFLFEDCNCIEEHQDDYPKHQFSGTSIYRPLTATIQFLVILNAVFFLLYGFQALHSRRMIEEFNRFGLTDTQRKLTGGLQIAGSAGLLTGFVYPLIGLLASAGFTAMMFLGFIVRIKIKDSFVQSAPALFFMLINAWLTIAFYELLK